MIFRKRNNRNPLVFSSAPFLVLRGTDCKECGDYLRLVLSLLAIVFSAFGASLVLLLYCINRFHGKR